MGGLLVVDEMTAPLVLVTVTVTVPSLEDFVVVVSPETGEEEVETELTTRAEDDLAVLLAAAAAALVEAGVGALRGAAETTAAMDALSEAALVAAEPKAAMVKFMFLNLLRYV